MLAGAIARNLQKSHRLLKRREYLKQPKWWPCPFFEGGIPGIPMDEQAYKYQAGMYMPDSTNVAATLLPIWQLFEGASMKSAAAGQLVQAEQHVD